MYLLHFVKGRQRNDCDATSCYTGRVEPAAKGLCKSKDGSFDARSAVSREISCYMVRTFSFRYGFALLAVASWTFPLRPK